jgi:SnoaL-like polyketide cyclase
MMVTMKHEGLPFALPERPSVTRIRQRNTAELLVPSGHRTQPMAGFEDNFTDIVDYIIRITEQIWVERAVGRIYETYDANCTVYTTNGIVRSVEEVIASTAMSLHAAPDGESHHLNVAWSGDEVDGFYTSHLGFARSTNIGASPYGPATGKRIGRFFVADCVSRNNFIHTEWLVRDNGTAVRQMGFNIHETAQRLAERSLAEPPVLSVPTRLNGQVPRKGYDGPTNTIEGWVEHHFSEIWNQRRFDHIPFHYAPNVIAHWAGGRVAHGAHNLGSLIIAMLASLPDATMRVEHVSWSDETDGVIVAVRWMLEGTTRPGGLLGSVPSGRPVGVMGMSHFRFAGLFVVEEWTIFDEVAVLAQAYRA